MQTLDKVIREYMIEIGEVSEHKYARFLQIAYGGLREINMDVSGITRVARLSKSTTDTINLPEDYIDYLVVGICDTDSGLMSPLGINNNICLPRTTNSCGGVLRSSTSTDDDSSASWATGANTMYRNGEVTGGLFGLGGGNNKNGYYRIDDEKRMIVLDAVTAPTIVLEYIADPQKVDDQYQVHTYDIEAVKAYIYWKSIERNRTYGLGDKESARQEWRRKKKQARKRHKSFTINEALQSIRKSFKQVPKA